MPKQTHSGDKKVHWRRRTAEVSSYMPPTFARRAPRRLTGSMAGSPFREVFSNRRTAFILGLIMTALLLGFVVGHLTRKPAEQASKTRFFVRTEAPIEHFVPLSEADALKTAHELLKQSGLDAVAPLRIIEFEKSRYLFIFRYEYQLGGGAPKHYVVSVMQDEARTPSLEERSAFSLRAWLE